MRRPKVSSWCAIGLGFGLGLGLGLGFCRVGRVGAGCRCGAQKTVFELWFELLSALVLGWSVGIWFCGIKGRRTRRSSFSSIGVWMGWVRKLGFALGFDSRWC